MSTLRRSALSTLLLLLTLACALAAEAPTEEHYYAVEINGTLCGYAHVQAFPSELEGRATTRVEQRLFVMLSALGSEFNTEMLLTYEIDPVTGNFLEHHADITQGRNEYSWSAHVEGDTARITSSLLAGEKTVELPPDAILPNPLSEPHLKQAFVEEGLETRAFEILEVRDAELQTTVFTLAGSEELELAGKRFDTIIVDGLNQKTALKSKLWVDRETAQVLQAELPGNRRVYLDDATVAKRIELVNLDSSLIAKTNVSIPDIHGITYMKVRAVLEPHGLWITPESLNVPGQKFTGTVTENRIDGVFEIEHAHYDGTNAPPFPPDFSGDESLKEYLEPSDLIESADPVLIEKAKEITAGSKDSWEAVRRLSAWVAENIDYAIPGGTTARGTYDTRTGECGSHSNLVAGLSRAVGIPARVIWGCMYIPNLGGAFGQHGWNEVYMGQAGWIPLDATANEVDFVDSGHIRIGIHESAATAANPVEFEILDHRIGSGEAPVAAPGQYEPYLGEYTQAETRRTMTVLVSDGALAVDIPGQIVLALNDPDEEGRWYAKLAPTVFVTFGEDRDGHFEEMQIHEIVRMQRTATPEEIDADVPERFHPYLGTYLLAQLNAEFTVIYRDDSLAVEDPLAKRTVGLKPPDAEGRWVDEFDKNTIRFEREEDGVFMTMVVDSASTFRRAAAVAAEAAAVLEESPEVQAVKAALRGLHQAGADADAERLFGCFDPDAIIFGTDKSERFTLEEYRNFAGPYLAQGHGWTSVPTEQNVYVSDDGNFAWFDERLDKPGFQELRGTGVMRKVDGSWKVLQMNTAFTVPNELAGPLAEMARELDQEK
jgi:hypothetical protein